MPISSKIYNLNISASCEYIPMRAKKRRKAMEDLKENKIEANSPQEENLKKEFTNTWAEEEKKSEEKWQRKMGDNMKYLELLNNMPFKFSREGFAYIKDDYVTCVISNIFIFPQKMINIDNGEEITSFVELKGILNNRRGTS